MRKVLKQVSFHPNLTFVLPVKDIFKYIFKQMIFFFIYYYYYTS